MSRILLNLHPRLAQLLCALTLVCGICPPATADEPLGRLFFTPERRQMLDQQRQFNIQEKQVVPEDETLTINGVVTRSSGKRTVWVNGVAQSGRQPTLDENGVDVVPSLRHPGKVTIHSSLNPPGQAMVGETIDRITGQTTDLLGGGTIRVTPSRPGK